MLNNTLEVNNIYHGDCLELMQHIPDKSIDMILCDLPYGTTACKWDTIIPFEPLWEQYERIIKDNGAIVLFGAEPFTSTLITSNLPLFKYNWYWNKKSTSGFLNAKLKPMNTIETISVFSKGKTSNGNKNNMVYYPQGLIPYGKRVTSGNKAEKENTPYRETSLPSANGGYIQKYTNYPRNYLEFPYVKKAMHPTQKNTELCEYLIRTYTNEGETILDNCAGSFTTAVACDNLNRNWICMEKETSYCDIGFKRINENRERLGLPNIEHYTKSLERIDNALKAFNLPKRG